MLTGLLLLLLLLLVPPALPVVMLPVAVLTASRALLPGKIMQQQQMRPVQTPVQQRWLT
jgi:hypothetical protein